MRNDIHAFKDKLSDDHVHFKIDFSNKHEKFLQEIHKLQE